MKKNSRKRKTVPSYTFTESEIARTFTEWDRRYRENPEQFWSEAQHLLKSNPKDYGEACAPYFLKIHREICGEVVCR